MSSIVKVVVCRRRRQLRGNRPQFLLPINGRFHKPQFRLCVSQSETVARLCECERRGKGGRKKEEEEKRRKRTLPLSPLISPSPPCVCAAKPPTHHRDAHRCTDFKEIIKQLCRLGFLRLDRQHRTQAIHEGNKSGLAPRQGRLVFHQWRSNGERHATRDGKRSVKRSTPATLHPPAAFSAHSCLSPTRTSVVAITASSSSVPPTIATMDIDHSRSSVLTARLKLNTRTLGVC